MGDLAVKSIDDIIQPSDLPARINAEHDKVKDALQRGAMHAIEAGRLLLQAKATVQHGEWLDWVGLNCAFKERTAESYMRLAEAWPLLEANSQCAANLTYNGALKLLEQLKNPDEARMSSSTRRKRRSRITLERAWDEATENERDIQEENRTRGIGGSRPDDLLLKSILSP